MQMRTLAVLMAAVFLASCGGGGGSSPPVRIGEAAPPEPGDRTQPGDLQRPPPGTGFADPPDRNADADFSPTGTFGEHPDPAWSFVPGGPSVLQNPEAGQVLVGHGLFGTQLANLSDLSAGSAHGAFGSFYGELDDGTDAATLNRLLTTDEHGGRISISRWGATPPTVHVAAGTTGEQFEEVRIMVGLLNSALPRDWQLTLSVDRVDTTTMTDPEEGRIVVEFTTSDTWPEIMPGDGSIGLALFIYNAGTPHTYIGARVFVDPVQNTTRSQRLMVLGHEMLHVLGREHVDPATFANTLLHTTINTVPAVPGILPQMDIEALLATYGFLTAGQDYTMVATALGPWETESAHFAVEGSFASGAGLLRFGAVERNGHVRPWAFGGPLPDVPLASNALLSGSATWTGRLAGLTPTSSAVAGAAEMTVELADLTGTLDFTGLEFWTPGSAPGAVGSGMQWGDGDLEYGIQVTANTFARTSGDDGEVEGAFAGNEHEAMLGVLTRDDLSAGFGGIRE